MSKDLHILYGRGDTENIVATEPIPNKQNVMEVFIRDPQTDEVQSYLKSYKPFVWLNDKDSIMDELYDDTNVIKLMGGNFYNCMVQEKSYGLVKWIEKEADSADMPYTQCQWMVQSGETQYKGMGFDDPLRMYLDIEVITKDGFDFPNSSRKEDKIVAIGMYINRPDGYTQIVLNEDKLSPELNDQILVDSEKEMLEKFVVAFRDIDPDIIITHNGFNFDWPYIEDRAQMHGVELKLGRNGSNLYSFGTSIKFAEKSDKYENYMIYGRHLLDTYFMAKQYDVVARDLENYQLKYCAKYLDKANDDRVYIAGDELSDVWKGRHPTYTRTDLLKYLRDDTAETQALDQAWGRNMFAQTQMLPLPMQDVFRYGSGNKIDLMFMREYYHYRWSWSKPEPHRDFKGGYAGTGVYGLVTKPTVYMDVGSMYPTLSELLGIQPKSDELRIYPKMIRLLKSERYKYKDLMYEERAKGNDEIANRHDATQGGLKILLNTASFGYVGSRWGSFNDYDEAERITTNGQKITKRMLHEARELGGVPVKWDTDGALVTVPKIWQGSEESETEFIKTVEWNINRWIENGGLNG